MSALLVFVSVVLGVWAALTQTEYVTWGTYNFLLALAAAFLAASFLPWVRRLP